MEIGVAKMQPNSILSASPSFNSYSSDQFAEIAAKVIREMHLSDDAEDDLDSYSFFSDDGDHDQVQEEEASPNGGGDDEDDFEFTFVCQEPQASTITADEIFSNGQIRPVFPVFNRDVFLAEHPDRTASIRLPLRRLLSGVDDDHSSAAEQYPPSSSSSSTSAAAQGNGEVLKGIPEGTYCVWTPRRAAVPAEKCQKSNSTGSSKRWRLRDLMHRSSSDGKEAFVFLTPAGAAGKKAEKLEVRSPKSSSLSVAAAGRKGASAHEVHYMRNRAIKEGDRRRSYLPYRQDLVGFFANVNGLGKAYRHPF